MNPPNHVAIIMDGNGRWAQARSRSRTYGHLRGARAAKKIIRHAATSGVKNLTLFTFSMENWLRPLEEVQFLMRLLAHQIRRERSTLMENNIRFKTIGDLSRLPRDVKEAVDQTVAMTAGNSGMNLVFALSYGGRQEILSATQAIAAKVKSGELDPNEIDAACFQNHLEANFLPDPDLIIRTSGEYRLSNFFLWESAYSELVIVEKMWPEFGPSDFDQAVQAYSRRERRFGRVNNATPSASPT